MKIVYVGDFSKTYSSEVYVAYALEQCGVEVIRWPEFQLMKASEVVESIANYKPDFVLFCKARFRGGIARQVIHELKRRKILTVTWLFDLYLGLPNDVCATRTPFEPQFSADMVFTTDGGHDKEWKELGVNHYLLRQGIHEPEAFLSKKRIDTTPIVFVGSKSFRKRTILINTLQNVFTHRFTHYGDENVIRGTDLNDLYASAKIVVGDSQPSPNYWSNRIYETLGRGGFLIHPFVEGMEKEFEYYKHFIPYEWGNVEQIKEIVKYFLTHDKEREKIRLAGHEFVKKNYTYKIRCQQLIQEVQKYIGTRG